MKTPHEMHRSRIDAKAAQMGLEFMEEHEQLEKLLFVAIPRANTNETAHALLQNFGSIYGVLTAEVEELCRVPGVGRRTAEFLHDLLPLMGIVERSAMRNDSHKLPVLTTTCEMGDYAKTLLYGKLVECFYLISLNGSRRVIRFDKISEGTSEETAVYVQRIVKTANMNHAKYVILVHNHPGGSLTPSLSDLDSTREAAQALQCVGVTLLDHFIVSRGEWFSMRENKMM